MRSIKSLEKGLLILHAIAGMSDGARVKGISEAIGGSISNLTLYLDSLVNAGFVRKDAAAGKYYLSHKIVDLARKAEQSQYSLLKQVAMPELERLSADFNENVLLAAMDGHDMHFIVRLQSKRSVQVLPNADIHYPPHVTAAGKAILAFLPDAARERYLDDALYHHFTEKSLVNPHALRQQLRSIREQGYAVNYGEYESEIMAVASPVLMKGGSIASVVVQFPSFRYREEALPAFGERIKQATQAIEQAYAAI